MTARLAAVAVAALAATSPAAAAVQVDATRYPTLALTVVTERATAQPPRVFEHGVRVDGVRAQNLGAQKSVVLAVDRSRSMAGAALADAVSGARAFLAAKPPRDEVAIVAFGSDALQLTRFTTGAAEPAAALAGVRVDRQEGTSLYDAVALGVRALRAETVGARLLVVLSDGKDVSSSIGLRELIETARRSQVLVYAIGVEGRGFAAAPLRRLAAQTGGRYFRARSSGELAAIYGTVAAELERTWRLEYPTAARPGRLLRLRVVVPGQRAQTVSAVVPGRASVSGGGGPARTIWGDLLVAVLVGALVVTAARFVASYRRAKQLRRRLQVERAAATDEPHASVGDRVRGRAARLFDTTERRFGRRSQWHSLERALNQADMPLRAVELLYAALAAGVTLGFLALLFGAASVIALLLLALGFSAPIVYVRLKARRRMRAFDEQLPDLLMTLASSLKAGHSFRQGLQTVVDEGRDPARKEFQRVLSEARLGRTLDDALADMAARLGSENFTFVVSAVTIQRRVGGSLSGIFDMVAESVRRRQLFGRRLKALTAQGRISAYVLVALPVFLGLALTAINPGYMAPLFGTRAGHFMLMAGVVLMSIGGVILKRIASFAG